MPGTAPPLANVNTRIPGAARPHHVRVSEDRRVPAGAASLPGPARAAPGIVRGHRAASRLLPDAARGPAGVARRSRHLDAGAAAVAVQTPPVSLPPQYPTLFTQISEDLTNVLVLVVSRAEFTAGHGAPPSGTGPVRAAGGEWSLFMGSGRGLAVGRLHRPSIPGTSRGRGPARATRRRPRRNTKGPILADGASPLVPPSGFEPPLPP